ERDLAVAMICQLVIAPCSKLSMTRRFSQTTLGDEPALGEVTEPELLAGASTEEEIFGPGGVFAGLTKRLVERAMEVELTDHVGYEPHCEPPGGAANQRNGTTSKTLITDHGKVPIDAPRDRDGSFEPQIVSMKEARLSRPAAV
ncbi:MAG TPA: transposase, partial [Candidatus Dormibacteraeota bacterium]